MLKEIEEKLKALKIDFKRAGNKIIIEDFDEKSGEGGADMVIIAIKGQEIQVEILERKVRVRSGRKFRERMEKGKRQIQRTAEWLNERLSLNKLRCKEIIHPKIELPRPIKSPGIINIKGRKLMLEAVF